MANEYPTFIPPTALSDRTPREWSEAEAERYQVWLLGVLDQRTDALLGSFDEKFDQTAEVDLAHIGYKAADLLRQPGFSTQGEQGPKLTDRGYALAADMGLLVARALFRRCGGNLEWTIVKKPKSDVAYHLPVIKGKGKMLLEPVGGSIAEAHAILRGARDGEIWSDMFAFWLEHLCGT